MANSRKGRCSKMVMTDEIMQITNAIVEAIPAETIYLFGSYARGTPNENSDYDFFVVIPDGGMKPLEAAQKANQSLSKINRRTPVDILADYRSNFEERKNFNTLERRIAREGVVLYERT
ncbi:MAG: nucleotidyltransferase domain-containing protein [Leptospirales bacterium]|nr:nucleotidyltransferase domain-containing protein [Leptospirales bacterium]